MITLFQTKNEKDRQIDDLNTSQKTIEKQLAIKVEESFKAEGTASARIERLAEVGASYSLALFHTLHLPIPLFFSFSGFHPLLSILSLYCMIYLFC